VARRWLIVPDAQLKPGQDLSHIDWAAQAIVDYLPDVVIQIGDWWDMHSLSTYETPGSKHMENIRVKDDIECGNEAFQRLVGPMNKEIRRREEGHRKRWEPETHFFTGNHEARITKAIQREPKWEGVIGLEHLLTPGFTRHNFLDIVTIDGIKVCHFFPNPYTGKAIGGTIINRLNHIGSSFIQGHQQGFLYASKQFPDHVKHGLVCGRFYREHEHYRPRDVQNCEFNGVVVLNEVENGSYDIMPLSMGYLQRTYG
jgi:hypothetical protein